MSMISSLAWIPRGIAAEHPTKCELTPEEIEMLMNKAKDVLGDDGDNEQNLTTHIDDMDMDNDSDEEEEISMNEKSDKSEFQDDILKELNMDDYDNEPDKFEVGGLQGLTYHANNNDDPYVTFKGDMDKEDLEDFNIKPTDNLILVGQTEEEMSRIEVYVYEEDCNNLFVHHDILVAGVPLCLEPINYHPEDPNGVTNLVAVGTMLPQIEIWDLDIVDGIEPVMTLGELPQPENKNSKKKKKTKIVDPKTSHTDAVLGLSWNPVNKNVLASCSADKTVKIWDLAKGECIYSFSHHTDKIQALKWNPLEPTMLLTGSYDKTCCLVDSRYPAQVLRWNVSSDIECLLWNPHQPEQFLASCDDGMVFCFDARFPGKTLYSIHAHDGACCSIAISKYIPGCLVTCGADKIVKTWDIQSGSPTCVHSRSLDLGPIYAMDISPDSPFVVAAGGGKGCLNVWSIAESANVVQQFNSRAKQLYK